VKAAYTKAMASDRFVTYSGLFVFEELRKILGDVTMLESLLIEPEWIHDSCTLVTTKNIEHFELLFSEVGLPDGSTSTRISATPWDRLPPPPAIGR
jgi:hypothetical protein